MEATLLQCGLYRDRVLRSDRTHSQQAHASPIQKISKPAWHAPIVLQLRLERARHAAILHYQLVRKKYFSIRRLRAIHGDYFNFALSYCTGHLMSCPRARAASSGQ